MLTFNIFFISLMAIFQIILTLINKDKNKQVMVAQTMMFILIFLFAIFS